MYVCACLSVCVYAYFVRVYILHEIFTQNAYGATDVSFGVFDPLAIASFELSPFFSHFFAIFA